MNFYCSDCHRNDKFEAMIPVGYIHGPYIGAEGRVGFPDPMLEGWLPCDGWDITDEPGLDELKKALRRVWKVRPGVRDRLPDIPGSIIKAKGDAR